MEVIGIGESMVSLVNEPKGYIRHADSFKPYVAGAEMNTLIGLSRLGHETSWVSALGKDELGELILHKVRAENVDTSHVLYKDKRTGVFFKQISPDGSVDVTYYRGDSAASNMDIRDLDMEVLRQAKVLYLTGITLSLSESAKKMLFEVVSRLGDDVKVVFDPNIRLKMWSAEEARETILEFLPHVDCLIAGRNEVKILLGAVRLDEALDTFREYGCGKVVLKLGKEGAMYDFDGVRGSVKNPRQFEEIDPVGAGDAFAAGIVSGLLNDEGADGLIGKACFLGGYITQFIGDYQGFPSADQLWASMENLNDEKVNR
ncbi:MAG TPA: sugar kinase [Candidatus Salinicoccus stercoripullorum]|uniref:Sugar kinase n=1 Tax=Candidatus Salinicoccus stercoripullorum TaxID=2838756 RepID=A0A9D1U0T9_9STAP|nr:sugar kinase [Candidatus Salinicoccus stercoripullorum]